MRRNSTDECKNGASSRTDDTCTATTNGTTRLFRPAGTQTTGTQPPPMIMEHALMFEDDDLDQQRKRIQEFTISMDTKRIAEEAQDEELLQLALELSVSDTASEQNRLNLNDISEGSSTRTCHTTTNSTLAHRQQQQSSPVTIRRNSVVAPQNLASTSLQSSQQHSRNNRQFEFPRPLFTPSTTAVSLSTAPITSTHDAVVPTHQQQLLQKQQQLQQEPRRRSILRQPVSTRSLEGFIFSPGATTTTSPNNPQQQQQLQRNGDGSFTIHDLNRSNSNDLLLSNRKMISRTISASSDNHNNDRSDETLLNDQLSLGNSADDFDFDDIEDDEDEDDDMLEDLDPDDTPELKRVQHPQQQNASQTPHCVSPSITSAPVSLNKPESSNVNRTDESAVRKKSSIPLNGADLSAASLRFQQFSSSLPDGLVQGGGGGSIEQRRYGKRPVRPGLVVSVSTAAPKVKPPGRPRTAVSRQSPAIDDDALRKIQTSSSVSSNVTNSNNRSNNLSTSSNPQSENPIATASKPGAVSMMGSVQTKAPEARSAIVSHVLGGSGRCTVNHEPLFTSQSLQPQSDDSAGRRIFPSSVSTAVLPVQKSLSLTNGNDSDQISSSSTGNMSVSDHTPRRQSSEDMKQTSRLPTSGTPVSHSVTQTRGTVWNNANVSPALRRSSDSTKSDWPSITEQRNIVASSDRKTEPSNLLLRTQPRTGDNDVTSQEQRDLERAIRESAATEQKFTIAHSGNHSDDAYNLAGASQYLSREELLNIQEALNEKTQISVAATNPEYTDRAKPIANFNMITLQQSPELEDEAIARALREADEEEERRSLELAIMMQREESKQYKSTLAGHARLQQYGNVRSMTRQEYDAEMYQQSLQAVSTKQFNNDVDNDEHIIDGFRMNSSAQHKWSRHDQTSVVGPNQEIRTKHDRTLHNEANAHRLGLIPSNGTSPASVGNQAYNSFVQSMKNTTKGVAMKGTGRAGSDTDATKGGAMDPIVRQHIARAINNETIEKCNGVVKEGKEAVIYHADKGAESGGFDVAVKVFKKITEFRNRAYYVDGDPRFFRTNFRALSSKEQLEVWTEKEFRNLTRASRAGVPVPIPLSYKDNILFMRFLGDDGWPAPQLRELELNHGSRRWNTLFSQIMEAVKVLYQGGQLVHGDLSEYNILVAPSHFVIGQSSSLGKKCGEDLQVVLIDFGQAVDTRHPDATKLLERDLDRILSFFTVQGIDVPPLDEAMALIIG